MNMFTRLLQVLPVVQKTNHESLVVRYGAGFASLQLAIVVVSAALLLVPPGFAQQPEVSIGAQAWNYDRVYPLLDGLFQDTASTQIQSLTLNPNSSNSAQLNAVIQSFELQAGYNQLASVQNSAAAQMAVANLGLQSTLAQQQESILQQQIAAQQQLNQANQALTQANQSGNATQIAAAQSAVNAANASISNLSAEQALIKGPSTPYAPSTASTSLATSITGPPTTGVPSTMLTDGAQGTPSFPATKQLDNQMDLLWSRLARVVGTMAKPDSMGNNDRLYLIEFDTATFPNRTHKERLLDTGYQLSCPGAPAADTPRVADMFPRVAAINVTSTQYKDSSFSLGAILAFFGFGLNAAYNREHLNLSQMLGQSSYITGYGVGQAEFGWRFGIQLGDHIVSSDTKRTFALIDVPAGCANPLLQLADEQWFKLKDPPGVPEAVVQPASLAAINATMSTAAPLPAPLAVASLSFNRTAYNPSNYSPTNPALASLEIMLNQPMDQQATLYANGILLRRVRDTFGRAIQNSGGSGGLLEESTAIAQANTWMPISSRSLLVTLDGGMFGDQFPTIQIVGPGSYVPFTISGSKPAAETATVSGSVFQCAAAPCQLPSIAYPQTTSAQVGVTRWVRNPAVPTDFSAVFTVVQQAANTPMSSPASGAAIQLVTGSTQNVWGPNVEVYMQFSGDPNGQEFKLNCDPPNSVVSSGQRLVCEMSNAAGLVPGQTGASRIQFHVVDPGHAGGPLEAWSALPDCAGGGCVPPTAWNITNPSWNDASGQWNFQVQFINVAPGTNATLVPTPPAGGTQAMNCSPNLVCTATFGIRPQDLSSWYDHMNLQITGDATDEWQLLNLRTLVSPTVSVMSTDFTSWTGANLVPLFSTANDPTGHSGLLISGAIVPLDCPVVTACTIADKTKLPTSSGIMYLKSGAAQYPLLQLNADGSTSPIMYQPPKVPATTGNALAASNQNPGANVAQTPTPISGATNPVVPAPAAKSTPLFQLAIPNMQNRQAVMAGGPK